MPKYKITNLTKAEAPEGSTTGLWYSYVISNELNTLTGIRSGSEKEVKQIAKNLVQHLNETYLTHYKVKTYNKPVNEAYLSSFV